MTARTNEDFLVTTILPPPTRKKMPDISKGLSLRFEFSLEKAVAPLRTRKSKSPKGERGEHRHAACTNIVQSLVGQLIGCDPRHERPYCYSSVTMPDFEPEDSFIIRLNSDISVEADYQVDSSTEALTTRLPDMWAVSRQLKDSPPSLPLRRTSIQSQTDTGANALARAPPLTVEAARDSFPTPPSCTITSLNRHV